MEKPKIIQQLEKQIEKEFINVNISKIKKEDGLGDAEYSTDSIGNVNGLVMSRLDLKEIPSIIKSEAKRSLGSLEVMRLKGNKIKDVSILNELINLKILNLEVNEISDISTLKELKNLSELWLFKNQISDISAIKELKKLSRFSLSNNNSSDIPILNELKGLVELNLAANQITDITALKGLVSLRRLNLEVNQIIDISPLTELVNLQFLMIYFNQIKDISPLKGLKNLNEIYIDANKIQDISALKELKNLSSVEFSRNEISDISDLKELKNIKSLRLSGNQIYDISVLKELTNLKSLDLSKNKISDISVLKELKNLEELDLSGNEISNISVLKELKNLKKLNLSKNPIIKLQSWITDYPNMDVQWKKTSSANFITFYENPIEGLPIEIIKQGRQAIKNWFNANRKELNEIKVILIGEAKSGKTSLLRRLQKDEYNPKEEQTDGIIIETFDFEKLQTFKEQKKLHGIKAYFWDFGGQEIMSSTHQFFLTNRSVYILVLEARKDEKADKQVQEWLKRIQTFGGNSPVIIAANKIDENPAFGLDTYQLKIDFPQIKGFVRISCDKNTGINDVKKLLEEFIPKAELFKTEIDEKWFPIKDSLQNLTCRKQYITKNDFEEICSRNELINEVEQLQAIRFLNDLGIVLHFSDLRMSEYFVLDPYWVTTGVYRIITSNFAATKKGEILFLDLDFVVNKEEHNKEAYIPEKQRKLKYSPNELCYISEIMAEFKLSYFSENREKILIPDLLDKETPASEAELFLNSYNKLNLIYQYKYLPVSIIHFLMVEMKQDIKKAWRTGIILECKSNIKAKAMVVASENRINISVIGEHRNKRDYLSIIRFFLDKVNSKFSLITDLLIPLPDTKDRTVEYIVLSNMEKVGEMIYKDYKIGKEYNVSELLNGVVSYEIIQKQASIINNMYVLGDKNLSLKDIEANDIDFKGKSKEEIMGLLYKKFLFEFDNPSIGNSAFIEESYDEQVNLIKKILFLSASPLDEDRLRVDEECKKIENGIEKSNDRDNLKFITKLAVDFEGASLAMLKNEPNIVHFSGHGSIFGIAFENELGDSTLIIKDTLIRLFSLYKEKINCVILNACKSIEIAKDISKLGFYVVGMSSTISDKASIAFSVGFYQALGEGKDINFAFKLGLAHLSVADNREVNIPTLWLKGNKIEATYD
jgi:internalin A